MILAIIPARGGSKGVPRKNLRAIGGKPLVAHSIEQALQASLVNRVIVSTDDASIAAVARDYGAEVIDRPAEISGDGASSESALLHVLQTLRQREGLEPELVVFLQATSPLRRAADIDAAIEMLESEAADSLFSAFPLQGFVWRRQATEVRSLTYAYRQRPRRQDAPEDWVENGALYVFKPWLLHQLGNRLGGKIVLFPMPASRSFQIDEPGDFELVESLLAAPCGAGRTPSLDQVRMVVFDFDGVMTDDHVLVDQDGVEAVRCHRGDGLGIERLRQAGIRLAVLSKETNPVVAARCEKLRLHCLQGLERKLPALEELARQWSMEPGQVAYVGNDINDLECMAWAGVAIAVADAPAAVRAAADLVTSRRGGHGAVREISDRMLAQRAARAAAAIDRG
ncbi:MAG TPA: acylneuraminate cytidylyltransferase [Acidobacteriota bacterium]